MNIRYHHVLGRGNRARQGRATEIKSIDKDSQVSQKRSFKNKKKNTPCEGQTKKTPES